MTVDVAVIGAGPAGIAATLAAADAGLSVALVDAAANPGGQFWRSPSGTAPSPGLYHLRRRFDRALARLDALVSSRRVARLAEHHVWAVEPSGPGWAVRCLRGAEPRQAGAPAPVTIQAARLVLATGAYDRQLPFPGWDLPGVMTAGGAQALLKGQLVTAGTTVVVAGTGPFLLPVAAGLVAHGARVPAVIEANAPSAFARSPRAVLGAAGKLGEALGYVTTLARHRVEVRTRQVVVRAVGTDRVEGVIVARLDRDGRQVARTEREINCDTLAVGWGFTPQLELHLQLDCATRVDLDGSLVVAVDDAQATTVDGVWAAGESTGVGGADLAWVEGTVAGRAVARSAGPPRVDRGDGRREAALRARRAALRGFAAAMHRIYPVPAGALRGLDGATVVCRCEEVSVDAIAHAVWNLGATEARAVKLLARPGMGWCQGRVCGYATACLIARYTGRDAPSAGDLHTFARRPLSTPVPLGQLAEDPEPPGPRES